jgi:hypothetical protein
MEAMEHCPWLVACEPGPMRFIRYCKFNIWEAARQLVKFWEVRKEFFATCCMGSDDFLRPMHQTGTGGALSPADNEMLSSGFLTLMPNEHSGDNSSNCPILPCLIPSRIPCDHDNWRALVNRAQFYVHTVIMEMTNDDKPCYPIIIALNWKAFALSIRGMEKTTDMLNYFPSYPETPFFVQIPNDHVGKSDYFQILVPPSLKLLNLFRQAGDRTHVVGGSSFEEIADQLEHDYGFCRDNLPPECGGTWGMDKFRAWQKERVELEKQRERHYMSLAVARMRIIGPPRRQATTHTMEQSPGWTSTTTTTTMDAASMKSLASAPRRKKKNPPAAAAMKKERPGEESQETISRNASSQSNHPPMQGAAGGAAPLTAMTRRRLMDPIHSKNKRIRRKQAFAQLQASFEDATAQNQRLKSENTHLEQMLKMAHYEVMVHHAAQFCSTSGTTQQDQQQQQQHSVHLPMATTGPIPQQQHQTILTVHPASAMVAAPAHHFPQMHQQQTMTNHLTTLNPTSATAGLGIQQHEPQFQQMSAAAALAAQQLLRLQPPHQWSDQHFDFLQLPNANTANLVGLHQQPAFPNLHAATTTATAITTTIAPTTTVGLQPTSGGHGTAILSSSAPSWWNLFARTTTTNASMATRLPTQTTATLGHYPEGRRQQEVAQQQDQNYERKQPPPSF